MLTRRQALQQIIGQSISLQAILLSSAQAQAAGADDINAAMKGDFAPVHDPCIIKEKDTYHLFSTSQMNEPYGLIHWRTSKDMINWEHNGAVMKNFPSWVLKALPETRGAWAPDVKFANGEYRIYYCASMFGKNTSVIGLITTPTLDVNAANFLLRDKGMVFSSSEHDDFNAIDPNFIIGDDGRHWLAFGSFWSGLKLLELDPQSGRPKDPLAKPIPIAKRAFPDAIEAPCVFRHGKYYYLTAAFDFCCRGVNSNYYTIIGRAADIAGPYYDKKGRKLNDGGGTTLLNVKSKDGHFKGQGGASVFNDGDNYYITYHAYDITKNGLPTLRINQLKFDAQDWAEVL